MKRVHFECEVLYGTLYPPLCENNAGRDAFASRQPVEMTDDESEVTCRRCLAAMGFEVANCLHPLRKGELGLTETHANPFNREAA